MIIFSLDCRAELMPNTIANLEAALAAHDESFAYVVFTGGIFNADKGQTLPAALLMHQWWDHHRTCHSVSMTEGSSLTTRQNITNVVSRLAAQGYHVADCDIYAVSERWHLLGIAYLFRRLHGVKVHKAPSRFRESLAGIRGRLIRLILYRLDPTGTGWLSRRKIKERGG